MHQQQSAAAAQQLNFNAFAAQGQAAAATLPPGYAYFYGQLPGMQAAYGSGVAAAYPAAAAAAAMGVPTTATTQFGQKNAYGSK